jgi:hypothetical protein
VGVSDATQSEEVIAKFKGNLHRDIVRYRNTLATLLNCQCEPSSCLFAPSAIGGLKVTLN